MLTPKFVLIIIPIFVIIFIKKILSYWIIYSFDFVKSSKMSRAQDVTAGKRVLLFVWKQQQLAHSSAWFTCAECKLNNLANDAELTFYTEFIQLHSTSRALASIF